MRYAAYNVTRAGHADLRVQVDFNRNPSGIVLYWADCFSLGTGPAMTSPEEAIKVLLKREKVTGYVINEWERWEKPDAGQSVGHKKRRAHTGSRYVNRSHPRLRASNSANRLEEALPCAAPLGA